MFFHYFILCHLAALTLGNPFHKVPFVFLLDVGNEEIPKSKAEQIRISVPGGSIALRYPAVETGDTIGHVRVSGIDFGTDLKANIVEGGPGYNFVIIMFVGKPGVEFDAVITVQTLSSDTTNDIIQAVTSQGDTMNSGALNEKKEYKEKQEQGKDSSYQVQEDDSDNTEENSENSEEQTQQSTVVLNYAENEGDNEIDINENSKDIHSNRVGAVYDENDDDEEERQLGEQESDDSPKAEPYTYSISDGYVMDESYDGEEPSNVDSSLYDKYKALKTHLYGEVNAPQSAVDDSQDQETDQIFNDEEVHDDADKYKDSNNNYFDSDGGSAVAS